MWKAYMNTSVNSYFIYLIFHSGLGYASKINSFLKDWRFFLVNFGGCLV